MTEKHINTSIELLKETASEFITLIVIYLTVGNGTNQMIYGNSVWR